MTSYAEGFRGEMHGRGVKEATILVLVCLGLLALPYVVDSYELRIAIFVMLNIGLASSWNIIGGMAGYPSFGHGAFFGIGAYVSAMLLTRYQMPLFVAVIAGGVVATSIAPIFTPLFRLRGFYFALATLASALAIENIVRNWPWARGILPRDQGWNIPLDYSQEFYYFVMLFVLAACIGSVIAIKNSKVGLALRVIQTDETAAMSVGIDVTRYKLIAFCVSVFWPGILGAIFAPYSVFISAETVFSLSFSLNMIVYSVFGGLGTVLGPVVGGLILTVMDQFAWTLFLDYHRIIYGALIVIVISLVPSGLVSLIEIRRNRDSDS